MLQGLCNDFVPGAHDSSSEDMSLTEWHYCLFSRRAEYAGRSKTLEGFRVLTAHWQGKFVRIWQMSVAKRHVSVVLKRSTLVQESEASIEASGMRVEKIIGQTGSMAVPSSRRLFLQRGPGQVNNVLWKQSCRLAWPVSRMGSEYVEFDSPG